MSFEELEVFNRFRFCPLCGAEKISQKSEKSILCSECGFTYYINAAGAVAGIIINESDEILLTIRGREPGKGMLDLPGGFIDLHETAEDALRREIKEELDSDIIDIVYLESKPNTYPFGGILYHTLDIFFKCSLTDYSKIRPGDDIAGFTFVKYKDIDLSRVAFDSVKKVLSKNLISK